MSTDHAVQVEPPRASPWAVLVSTSLAVFAVFLDTTILFVAFSSIGRSFPEVSLGSLSWVLNVYTIVFAATLIPAGRLADRIGRRKTFLGSVVLFTAASIACGLAPTPGVLVAARALQALGAAALTPASLALVLQTFPKPKIPLAVAIWGAIGAVAGAVGPTAGAYVVAHWGWRWAFYINLPVGLISLALGSRVLPEGREARRGRLPDPLSVVVLASALSLMAYAIVETERWGWGSLLFLGTFAASLALLAFFVWRSGRVESPVLDLKLFASPSFRWANLAMLTFSIGFSAMFLGNVLFFTQVWKYSIFQAGLAVSIGPLIVAITAPLFGRLAGRIGQRTLLVPGGIVWASGGLLLLARVTEQPAYVTHYLPALILTAFGVALCLPQLSSVSVQGLPPDSFGSGSAVMQAVRNLGATLGVAMVVAFTSDRVGATLTNFQHVWWLLVASGLSVTALTFNLPRRALSAEPLARPAPSEL